MTNLQKGWSVLHQAVFATFLLRIIGTVSSTPPTTKNVVLQISDGQIQNPIPTQSATSLFKATDIAGLNIIYVGSVGLNTLGSSTTELLGTAKLITTTNAAGSAVTGVLQVTTTSRSAITTIIPESIIPSLSSTPSIFAFSSADANGQPIINLGQTFVKPNGSTSTAVLETGISTSHVTISDSQDSTTVEIVGVFTNLNGSVVTNTLSFVAEVSSLTLSGSFATPVRHTLTTTTGPQTSLGEFSWKITGSVTNGNDFVSTSDIARNTGSKSARSQAWQGSSTRNVHEASLANNQQKSSSQRSTNLAISTFPSGSASMASSSIASTEKPNLLSDGLSLTHESSESIHDTGSVGGSIATASATITPGAHGTMSIFGKMASKSGLTTANGTIGGAVQAALDTRGHTTLSTTAQLTPMASVTARSNSTRLLSSAVAGGLLLAVQSDSAVLGSLTALLGEQLATVTTVPSGMSIETVTSTTCSTAFAMATTTAAGDTVTKIVPELCLNGVAWFLFGWTNIPKLCTKRFNLFGFLLQFICDRKTGFPVGVDIISYPSPPPPPSSGSSENSPSIPEENGQDGDDEPSNTQNPSEYASSTRSPYSARSKGSTFLTSSMRTSSATSFTSRVCSGAITVSGTSRMCCDNSTVIGPTTLCNYHINAWVEDLGPFLTASIPIPASARPISLPGTPIAFNSATLAALFDSITSDMVSYLANFTATTPATSRNQSTSALTASAPTTSAPTTHTVPALTPSTTATALGVGSGLLAILKSEIGVGEAEQGSSTAFSTPAAPNSNSNPVGLTQGAISTGEATSPTSALACTQYFYYANDGPNTFVCQCNDGTWNHRRNQDTYSLCPSQVTTVSLTIAYPWETTIPTGVSCTLVNYEPSSVDFVPFCECSNDWFFVDACPSSVAAATTTLTLSEPPASVTAALTKGDYITPTIIPSALPPSPTTSVCVPQCTKTIEFSGLGDEQVTCSCNPACGGNASPKPNSSQMCPNQVSVIG